MQMILPLLLLYMYDISISSYFLLCICGTVFVPFVVLPQCKYFRCPRCFSVHVGMGLSPTVQCFRLVGRWQRAKLETVKQGYGAQPWRPASQASLLAQTSHCYR